MNYEAEDFLSDESFLAWYYGTDEREAISFARWLDEHPHRRPDVAEAVRLLTLLSAPEAPVNLTQQTQAWATLQATVDKWEAGRTERNRVIPFYRRPVLAIAASLTALLLLAAGLFWYTQRPLIYETDYAQTRQLTLPDGSRVVLNANSRLRLARNWTSSTARRDVWLDGEAYFRVRHTASHARFVVHTGTLNVEVLGTSFNVRNRADQVRVLLDEGKVRLEQTASRQSLLMQPGQLAEADAGRIRTLRRATNPAEHTAWKDSRLVFNQTTLLEIARLIETNYGYPVRLAPGLADRTFTYSLYGNDLDLLLTTLAESLDLSVTRADDRILISEKSNL